MLSMSCCSKNSRLREKGGLGILSNQLPDVDKLRDVALNPQASQYSDLHRNKYKFIYILYTALKNYNAN